MPPDETGEHVYGARHAATTQESASPPSLTPQRQNPGTGLQEGTDETGRALLTAHFTWPWEA